MQPPSTEAVYEAVCALHNNPDSTEKEKASLWLGEVQKSIPCWKIADELLHQKRDLNSCYFAAQTMRSKIQHSFHELPLESHRSLRDSIIEHIESFTPDINAVIITQLCVALADLALQMTSWRNCANDLINKFSTSNVWALLEILTVLPQEIDSRSLRLGENRREEIKCELKSSSREVVAFLKQTLINAGPNTHVALKVVKCLTSWITIKAIEVVEIPENAVIGQCFQILTDHTISNNLHEAATDCICTLLQSMEENNNNESVERLVFNSVVSLEQSYHMAVAHEEQEKALNYSRIFTELAETFLEKVMNGCYGKNSNHFALKSLDLVLVCVGHHDYEVAEVSFNLWYRLSEILYHKDNEELTSVFKPHIERLIAGLCRHCQMEPDHQGLLEKGDDFYDFRMKVLELIRDVVFIIGSNDCFRQMFLSLQGTDVSWEQTEAALYVMQAVAKNILPEEYEIVPKVVEAILAMPDTAHTAVRKTCVLLLGELSEWIDRHPECLQSTLECLLRALQDDLLAVASAQSLHSVCKACKRHMAVHLNGLLQIVRTLDTFKLTPEAAIGLIRGVAAIIGHLPQDQVTVAMREATGIQLTALATLTSSEVLPSTKTSPADLIMWLDRLAALFRDVGTQPPENGHQHPCLQALIDAWPVISSAMDKYSRDSRAMERLCRTMKFSLRCVGKQAAPLLEPLVLKMISVYTAHGHSCFLYLGSILVDEFASEPGCVQGLMNMLQALIPKAFEILQQNNGLQENPDTVDDLFRLCMRFLQRAPTSFLQSPVMPAIMQCGILACTLDHRDANSSVMKFFYDLAVAGHSKRSDDTIKSLIETIINQYGQLLINSIIQATVFSLSAYLLADVADVILELMFLNRSALNQWLEVAIKQLPQNATTASATAVQMAQFHQTVMQCEKAKEMTRALREFSRLYR